MTGELCTVFEHSSLELQFYAFDGLFLVLGWLGDAPGSAIARVEPILPTHVSGQASLVAWPSDPYYSRIAQPLFKRPITLLITNNNCQTGNKAMAWVLLLYYQLAKDKGVPNSQTVYVDPSEFDAFQLCTVVVDPGYAPDIDEKLIREGAVIHILCDLSDYIAEHEDDFLSYPFVQAAISAHKEGRLSAIPETDEVFGLMTADEPGFNHAAYKALFSAIYRQYVGDKFLQLSR